MYAVMVAMKFSTYMVWMHGIRCLCALATSDMFYLNLDVIFAKTYNVFFKCHAEVSSHQADPFARPTIMIVKNENRHTAHGSYLYRHTALLSRNNGECREKNLRPVGNDVGH